MAYDITCLGPSAQIFTKARHADLNPVTSHCHGITDVAVQIKGLSSKSSHTFGQTKCNGGFSLVGQRTDDGHRFYIISTHLNISTKYINGFLCCKREMFHDRPHNRLRHCAHGSLRHDTPQILVLHLLIHWSYFPFVFVPSL